MGFPYTENINNPKNIIDKYKIKKFPYSEGNKMGNIFTHKNKFGEPQKIYKPNFGKICTEPYTGKYQYLIL